MRSTGFALAGCLLGFPQSVRAEPSLWANNGISLVADGGVFGFMERPVRDVMSADVTGMWGARLTLGSRRPFGLELGYAGSAANLHGLAAGEHAVLSGTGFDLAARYAFVQTDPLAPYAFVGFGWQHYVVQGADFDVMTAGMRSHDNLVQVPLGVGLAYRHASGLVIDVRTTLVTTSYDNLIRANATSYASMTTLGASIGVGYEL